MRTKRNCVLPFHSLLNLRSPRLGGARTSQQPLAKPVDGRPDQSKNRQRPECLFRSLRKCDRNQHRSFPRRIYSNRCTVHSLRDTSQEEKTWKSSWAASNGRAGRDRPAQIQSAIQSQRAYLASSRPVARRAPGGPLLSCDSRNLAPPISCACLFQNGLPAIPSVHHIRQGTKTVHIDVLGEGCSHAESDPVQWSETVGSPVIPRPFATVPCV